MPPFIYQNIAIDDTLNFSPRWYDISSGYFFSVLTLKHPRFGWTVVVGRKRMLYTITRHVRGLPVYLAEMPEEATDFIAKATNVSRPRVFIYAEPICRRLSVWAMAMIGGKTSSGIK